MAGLFCSHICNHMMESFSSETLVEARWILPMTMGNAVLENHAVAMSGSRIADVLPTPEARQRYPAAQVVRLPEHALIPGLVNLHTHAAMSLMRGLADDVPQR